MRTFAICAVAVVSLALSGCGRDSLESLRKQQLQTVKEANELLETIKDQASADKARPRLKELGDRWRDLEKRVDALPPVPAEEEARARKQYDDELNGAILRFLRESMRVRFVPGGQEVMQDLGELRKK
jgi:hypothetical protein